MFPFYGHIEGFEAYAVRHCDTQPLKMIPADSTFNSIVSRFFHVSFPLCTLHGIDAHRVFKVCIAQHI